MASFPLSAMPFLLRTFGTLELLGTSGERLAGAATQRKPLLILALAALTPGGIPRDQLLRALWPDGDPEKARATLKQHLYALRRATGETDLVGGSPRLRVDPALVEVDADRFVALVDAGRLREADVHVTGPLLEGIPEDEESGADLRALVAAIRDRFAARVALAAAAVAEEVPPAVRPVESTVVATRALRAAVRRAVQGMRALPADPVRADHRVAACTHDLLEALLDAEEDGVSFEDAARLLDDIHDLWRRSPLVRRMRRFLPGDAGDLEVEEWLLDGTVRCVDPIGAAVERLVLASPLARYPQAIAAWHARLLGEAAARAAGNPWRVLVLDAGAGRAVRDALPALDGRTPTTVLVEPRAEALALARVRLAELGEALVTIQREAFSALDEAVEHGPYDLILTGRLYDDVPASHGAWLTERLLQLLQADGVLACAACRGPADREPWHRYLADRTLAPRDREEMFALLGPGSMEAERRLVAAPSGEAWFAELVRRDALVG